MRADTLAAWAAAIAAVASATAAYLALNTAWRQEEIAKNQLDATYLTNLYTKQVDNVAQFENGFLQFRTVAFRDWPVPGKTYTKLRFTPQQYRAYVFSHYQDSLPVMEKFVAGAEALMLVAPIFESQLDRLQERASATGHAMDIFLSTDATDASQQIFSDAIAKNWPLLNNSYAAIRDCAQKILSQGRPIDEKTVITCSFPNE